MADFKSISPAIPEPKLPPIDVTRAKSERDREPFLRELTTENGYVAHPQNTATTPTVSMNPWARMHTHIFRPDRIYAAPSIISAISESTIPAGSL